MSGTVGASPIDLYTLYAKNEPSRAAASIKSNAQATALIGYFTKAAPGITSPDALLKNYKALSVVLGAFNLPDAIGNTAILRKLLTQDPTAKTSLANTLGNVKYKLLAQALSNWRTPPFATAGAVKQIVQAYTVNTFETAANAEAPGLANALYFTREAPSLKSVAAVQSDSNLLAVVITSLGLPVQNYEQLDFDQQTAILKGKFHPTDLQKPAYVTKAAEQYLVAQQSNAAAGPAPGSVAALYDDNADTSGDALFSIIAPAPAASGGAAGGSAGVLSLFA